jgi:hypothetical protein
LSDNSASLPAGYFHDQIFLFLALLNSTGMKHRFLLFFLLSSLVVFNGCQKELSFESGSGPSEGTLQDDGSGDCLPKSVAGIYVAGIALVGTTSYIEVQVNVTLPGSYSISSDTVNGIYFRGAGVFNATGLNTVRLKGNGTPLAAGIHNFVITYGTSGCTIAVTTSGSLATYTLNGGPGTCMGATPAGTYAVGIPLTASNTVTTNVDVTVIGAYSISTAPSNGITFTGSGSFTTTGPQAIVLTGTGTPVTAGSTNIPVTTGTSSCSFPVVVISAPSAATYAVNCGSAVINGTYTSGTPLGASNTVNISVNVIVAGSYTITTTATNGMVFSGSGIFAATGAQNISLTGSGTPAAAGNSTIPVTTGTAPCNFTVTVVAGAGAATFTVDCSSASPNGTYTEGLVLNATNTVDIDVNVTAAGLVSITTTATNGMTFTGSQSFSTTGVHSITLTGSGTPTADGTFSIPVSAGSTPCTFEVIVDPGAPPTDLMWKFTQGTTTYEGPTFAALVVPNPPFEAMGIIGETPSSDKSFSLNLVKSGAISTGSYSSGTLPPGASLTFLFTDNVTADLIFSALPGNSNLTVNLTIYDLVTHIAQGTFSGTVKNAANANVTITNGTFKVEIQ